ncbi:MAG: (Fe-S)-binding protein [Bacteroidales bacterium]|nr:(Fe-S)-binding protein [Bacteroidales bacterium]
MCGRCDQTCPVGIDITGIRQIKRNELKSGLREDFSYIKNQDVHKADVIYFAGCMSHLTPSIKKSVVQAFRKSGVRFWFMDEKESICCGRPMLLAGKKEEARILMAKNKVLIEQSQAKALVTNCPICYKMFRETYKLEIPVYHHSQYFAGLLDNNLLEIEKKNVRAVYHDPCELGRGSNVYKEPRKVLGKALNLVPVSQEKENALCCGGSLGNLGITTEQRNKITRDACEILLKDKPDMLVTSCPLCKKTFQKFSNVPVYDIAEIVNNSLGMIQPGLSVLGNHIKTQKQKQINEKPSVILD